MTRPFDPKAPLRRGMVVLEASAGTGKTYQITELVLRLVLEEGLRMRELLVVTFTRAATAELRDRIRRKLNEAFLKATNEPELSKERALLRRAIDEFDEALISTIHGFCQRMLDQYAFETGVEFGRTLVKDTTELRERAVQDVLRSELFDATPERWTFLTQRGGYTVDKLGHLASRVLNTDAPLAPEPEVGDELEQDGLHAHYEAARQLRERFAKITDEQQVLTYGDLLSRLARALGPDAPPERREALKKAIGERFKAALIDEFQDTDADQWAIFKSLFGDGEHFLYLIGDPKQAIYRFRGANVHVYTSAVAEAGDQVFTMGTNWRSDPAFVAACNRLMDFPDMFLDENIRYVRVEAAHKEPRFFPSESGPAAAALQIAHMPPVQGSPKLSKKDDIQRPFLEAVASDIAALLTSGAELVAGEERRLIRPGDIAVLTRKNDQGQAILDALQRVGVPAVRTGMASVFASQEALHIMDWMRATGAPGAASWGRSALASALFGWTAGQIESLDHEQADEWDRFVSDCAAWKQRWERHGFLAAFAEARRDWEIDARLLALPLGERRITNLRHLVELIHQAERQDRMGPVRLTRWLERQVTAGRGASEDSELRLERDDDAVNIMTLHKSKGLQFPVVYLPFLHDGVKTAGRYGQKPGEIVPDPNNPTQRVIYPIPLKPVGKEPGQILRTEDFAETMRLIYVGLTRAQFRAIACIPAAYSVADSGASHLLWGRNYAPKTATTVRKANSWAKHVALLEELAASGADHEFGVRELRPQLASYRTDTAGAERTARVFPRDSLDTGFRLTSYSALVAGGSSDDLKDHDGHSAHHSTASLPPAKPGPAVPLAGFPAGAEPGTFLHAIYEHADFQDPSSLAEVIDQQSQQLNFHVEEPEALVTAFEATLHTPIPGLPGGLATLPKGSRLNELDFALPLLSEEAGRAGKTLPADALAAFFERVSAPEIPSDYGAAVATLDIPAIHGMLRGSIDLVYRAGSRWYVADYKSNKLDLLREEQHPISHFQPDWMRHEMASHHYIIQGYLYAVALHRTLRLRLAGYDPDTHLGGLAYLFVRGMIGPETPAGYGVWSHRPRTADLLALDHLLTTGELP